MFSNKWWLWALLILPGLVWAGDPTRPPHLEGPTSEILHEPLKLSMILTEQGRERAVVNGKVLRVSEHVGDARLDAINEDHVVMTRAGQRILLRLSLSGVRQASKGEAHE